jgi:hypothetical protein
MTAMTGGCLCGAIRYELSAAPAIQFACHCRACQHASGGSPTYGLVVPEASVTLTQGDPTTYWSAGDSGNQVGRVFCGTCGAPVFSRLEGSPMMLVVKVGSLDDPSSFQVQADLWRDAAQPWHRPHEGAMSFPGNPPGA